MELNCKVLWHFAWILHILPKNQWFLVVSFLENEMNYILPSLIFCCTRANCDKLVMSFLAFFRKAKFTIIYFLSSTSFLPTHLHNYREVKKTGKIKLLEFLFRFIFYCLNRISQKLASSCQKFESSGTWQNSVPFKNMNDFQLRK